MANNVWLNFWFIVSLARKVISESLSGKHLRVLLVPISPILTVERNSSGHITRLTGVAQFAFELLAEQLNFTYHLLQDDVRTISDSPTFGKGAMSYIIKGDVDILCAAPVMTSQRSNMMDVPYIFLVSPLALLTPMPRSTTDAGAFWKPFQPYVWLSLLISLPVFIFCFWMAMKFLSTVKIESLKLRYNTMNEFYRKPFFMTKYAVSVLLSQGGLVFNHHGTAIRVGLAAFCLAAFVLNKAYSTVLISFAATPVFRPLINSVYDIPKNPRVLVTVDKDQGTDVFLRDETGEGVLKYIGNMLRNNPNLRCLDTGECLDQVRAGSSVYVNRKEIVLDLIGRDYKKTSQCDFLLAKGTFMTINTGLFAMAKNGPYTSQITIKLMEMEAAGFFRTWWKKMIANPDRCLNYIEEQKSRILPLNFGNVSGAFYILAVGMSLSFLVFLLEVIYRRAKIYLPRNQLERS